MNEQYLLAKPVKITEVGDDWFMSDLIYKSDNPGYVSFNRELLDGQFVSLSVREQQIREALIKYGATVERVGMVCSTKELEDAVVAILGIEGNKSDD